MLLRVALAFALVTLAVASPSVVRSREEIEEFFSFLENIKNDNGLYVTRAARNPLANPEEVSGKFEGDIVLDDFMIDAMMKEYAAGRNAYIFPNTKWPQNTVVWDYGDSSFNQAQRDAFLEGIRDIEEHTCIRFRRRETGDQAYVSVTGGAGGCFANVGFWHSRGVHTYNLALNTPGVGCFRHATIVHEWLHILGIFHMQSTHNRDDYVRIVPENINPGSIHNFNIYGPNEVSNLGVEYDYVSCMHYGPYAFSINGLASIIALREHQGTMGQREYITASDWLRVNRHYNCPGAWD